MEYWKGNDKKMNTGAILKACRTRAGMSQEDIANALYINQSDVSKYENDTKEPSISMFKEWATVTQTQEVLIAFIFGVDGIGMMQSVFETISTVSTIIGGIL